MDWTIAGDLQLSDVTGELGMAGKVQHYDDGLAYYLFGVLVQQQVVITKVAPTHVPVEILRLQVKDEYISKQLT